MFRDFKGRRGTEGGERRYRGRIRTEKRRGKK